MLKRIPHSLAQRVLRFFVSEWRILPRFRDWVLQFDTKSPVHIAHTHINDTRQHFENVSDSRLPCQLTLDASATNAETQEYDVECPLCNPTDPLPTYISLQSYRQSVRHFSPAP